MTVTADDVLQAVFDRGLDYHTADRRGNKWTAPCPSCRSSRPMRVTAASFGVLVDCPNGCTPAAIGKALDLPGLDLEAERARAEQAAAAGFLESAATLLVENDPGPTPFLVDQLIVDRSIAAIQGQHKRGKTWVLLELATAIVPGRRAFDRYEVPDPGPVMVILEESGRDALHRRLGALQRGKNLKPSDLLELHFAANKRVRLDDPEWQKRMLDAAAYLKPRAIFLDPLVRLKGSSVDENAQKEMAPVLDFMRDLRDASNAAVIFVHHTGHDGIRLRGTSDLEAYWESKITVDREPGGLSTLTAQHREAEATPELRYRLSWHDASRSMRLAPIDEPDATTKLRDDLLTLVENTPGQSTEQLAKTVHKRKEVARSQLENLERAGTVLRRQSQRTDRRGRTIAYPGWFPASQAGSSTVPDHGTDLDHTPGPGQHGPTVPPYIGAGPGPANGQADPDAALAAVQAAFPGSALHDA